MVSMHLTEAALTDENLEDVVAFFRASNPFAQETWGWDTGRFMDWRWSGNAVREREDRGWFGRHGRVFWDGSRIRVVSIAEYGGDEVCVITGGEDLEAVGQVVRRLMEERTGSRMGLSLNVLDSADWLATVLGDLGFTKGWDVAGHEWEYDLAAVAEGSPVPEGFTVESLPDDRAQAYSGIEECIQRAFNTQHDVGAALVSLESNPMFRPELSVFARSPEGRIAAYCRGTVDPDNGICSIDPVCTHPDFQRMGLSKAVVLTCFTTQRHLGGRFSYIGSAAEPAPSTSLYRSLGPSRRFDTRSWSLPDHGLKT